jgi:hypothetical protein
MPSGFSADHEMLDALAALRAGGMPVALVANSFGRDCYDGFDLHALADVVVISSDVGVRKPSRRIYAIACERLGSRTRQLRHGRRHRAQPRGRRPARHRRRAAHLGRADRSRARRPLRDSRRRVADGRLAPIFTQRIRPESEVRPAGSEDAVAPPGTVIVFHHVCDQLPAALPLSTPSP